VIAFEIRQAEEPLLQDVILFVPQGECETDVLMTVAKPGDAIFAPTVGAGTRMIVRKIVPRVTDCAVILADRSPLALGKVWSPAFPVNFSIGACLQPLLFRCHSNRREGVLHCIRCVAELARWSLSTRL
jgi:hypothetical protein